MAAMADHGIIFQYGALSTEPTVVSPFDLLGKSLTMRGYVLFEIVGDPQRLERGKKFVDRQPGLRQTQTGDRQNLPLRTNRRSPPLPGIEPTNRQNRGHGLEMR